MNFFKTLVTSLIFASSASAISTNNSRRLCSLFFNNFAKALELDSWQDGRDSVKQFHELCTQRDELFKFIPSISFHKTTIDLDQSFSQTEVSELIDELNTIYKGRVPYYLQAVTGQQSPDDYDIVNIDEMSESVLRDFLKFEEQLLNPTLERQESFSQIDRNLLPMQEKNELLVHMWDPEALKIDFEKDVFITPITEQKFFRKLKVFHWSWLSIIQMSRAKNSILEKNPILKQNFDSEAQSYKKRLESLVTKAKELEKKANDVAGKPFVHRISQAALVVAGAASGVKAATILAPAAIENGKYWAKTVFSFLNIKTPKKSKFFKKLKKELRDVEGCNDITVKKIKKYSAPIVSACAVIRDTTGLNALKPVDYLPS